MPERTRSIHPVTAQSASRRALPHGRRRLSTEQESILDLQRLAGNAAVASVLAPRRDGSRVTSAHAIQLDLHPAAPEGGLQSIRKRKGGAGILGLTTRGIEDSPPLFRAEAPTKGQRGWTTKARSVGSVPEPILDEYWPTQGPHKIADRTYIKVEPHWEDKLKEGEDEHAADATLAWKLTWKKVADTINGLAKEPGSPEATADDAIAALWKRYRAALPADLRPDGAKPSDDAQRDVLAVRGGTFFAWLWEATIVRDTRNYHEPRTKPADVTGDDVVSVIDAGQSKIPGPKSEELLAELRPKYTKGRRIIGSKLP